LFSPDECGCMCGVHTVHLWTDSVTVIASQPYKMQSHNLYSCVVQLIMEDVV